MCTSVAPNGSTTDCTYACFIHKPIYIYIYIYTYIAYTVHPTYITRTMDVLLYIIINNGAASTTATPTTTTTKTPPTTTSTTKQQAATVLIRHLLFFELCTEKVVDTNACSLKIQTRRMCLYRYMHYAAQRLICEHISMCMVHTTRSCPWAIMVDCTHCVSKAMYDQYVCAVIICVQAEEVIALTRCAHAYT
jgi:hypothetical protein